MQSFCETDASTLHIPLTSTPTKKKKKVNDARYLLIVWRWGKQPGKTQPLFSLLRNRNTLIFVEKYIFYINGIKQRAYLVY